MDEGDATETAHQSKHEILIGQIAFHAYALLHLTVEEEEYSRCRLHASRQGFVPNTRNNQIRNWRSINMAQNVADRR